MNDSADALPTWFLKALEAPERFKAIGDIREQVLLRDHRLVVQRLIPSIQKAADSATKDDAWKTTIIQVLIRVWLEFSPESAVRRRDAIHDQAQRSEGVAKAAEELLVALHAADRGILLCRASGVEPTTLRTGLTETELPDAQFRAQLKALARQAKQRAKVPKQEAHASISALIHRADEELTQLGARLSNAAMADFFGVTARAQRVRHSVTLDAVKKARARAR